LVEIPHIITSAAARPATSLIHKTTRSIIQIA
jgi:hypothetical protein